jgi:hypothetical protein
VIEPALFSFKPDPSPLVGRAFSMPFRVLATVLVSSVAYWMWSLWQKGLLAAESMASAGTSALKTGTFFGLSTQHGWLIAALLLLVYTLICILTSRTTLSETHVRQTWVWDKQMPLSELAYVKIIRVPGLDWLIAPRLYARSVLGKFNVFYAADPHMISEWQRLQRELEAFRLAQMQRPAHEADQA